MLINTSSLQANQILFNGSADNSEFSQAMINNINNTFTLSPSYFQITKTLNGVEIPNVFYDTWILDQESFKDPSSKKKIVMRPTQILNRGDIINWNNQEWLITNKDEQVFPYPEGVLEFCNDTLKCILPNGTLFETGCVITAVSKKSMTVEKDGSTMESEKMPFLIMCQNCSLSIQINPSYRFIFQNNTYRVEDIDDISQKGILIMLMAIDQVRPTDDFVNQIADNGITEILQPSGALIISGNSNLETLTSLNYSVVYDNGNPISGMEFVFTVSSTNAVITVIDGLNISIFGSVSSQFLLTATCGTNVLTKIISIVNLF